MSTLNEFTPLNIALLTVSDTRTRDTDTSGDVLAQSISEAGHRLFSRTIVKDDIYQLRATVSDWIANKEINAIICTGGTGFTNRDNTPEALSVLFDKHVEGFGELFRQISIADIGTSTIQSRALAGMANNTVVFCLPGSPNACQTAWSKIIESQLDARHKPCNFIMHLLKPLTASV